MAKSSTSAPHTVWAAGHALVLVSTLTILLGLITFNGRSSRAYYLAYSGALVSWGIVVYKSLGIPSLNRAYIQRALLDENVQYLLLALYFFFNKPIQASLIPFATFSLFHTLTFARTILLPKPPAASSSKKDASPASAGANLSKSIQTWVKKNYEHAMLFVSFVELGVMAQVTLGALTFQNSFLIPIVYAHFLRFRYYLSPQTRDAFAWFSQQLDHLTANPNCPPAVKRGVNAARDIIIRYAESVIAVQQQSGSAPTTGSASTSGSSTARPSSASGTTSSRTASASK
ncbi:uncharacterized protein L969DRAFT_68040 [Mixia osmundae IAM 14324]|uniref:Nucleoporin POM33 n=1 Tax=Mixia osmundae (strain CBS 9802 / IAM 14324 / JCM 22182 / KY 12970) TaxID=764103 RepID=G7E4E3_MIXOS|nr:uncharacterized protein L969DRAFT_68040 [Mixia osmundae IAM 14324]KEI36281.1 hypothetical protein L969DRAFT_68040 [Mixia osmundae IAM 14324]GAA97703.1 hypothetical protein E5Q_04381 [Mixia osmundae IAM 14324]